MGPVMVVARRSRALGALAIAGAVLSGVATSPGPASVHAGPACALRGFVPPRHAPGPRWCERAEPGCFVFDHPGYGDLSRWLIPAPIGARFAGVPIDLDGDGRADCWSAVNTRGGWRVDARAGAPGGCLASPVVHPAPAYVMSRALHTAAGPTAGT